MIQGTKFPTFLQPQAENSERQRFQFRGQFPLHPLALHSHSKNIRNPNMQLDPNPNPKHPIIRSTYVYSRRSSESVDVHGSLVSATSANRNRPRPERSLVTSNQLDIILQHPEGKPCRRMTFSAKSMHFDLDGKAPLTCMGNTREV